MSKGEKVSFFLQTLIFLARLLRSGILVPQTGEAGSAFDTFNLYFYQIGQR